MNRLRTTLPILACLAFLQIINSVCCAQGAAQGNTGAIRAGDRVAWVGGRLWEDMQDYGQLDSLLASRLKGSTVVFRNVAWSGDDVEGRARAVFGSIEDGYKRRLVDLGFASPTVVFLSYGQMEALDDEWSDDRFERGYLRLITDLKKLNTRIALIPPTTIPKGTRFPAARFDKANQRITALASLVTAIAKKEGCDLIVLPGLDADMTDDGLHPHPSGFQKLAVKYANALIPQTITVGIPAEIKIDLKSNSQVGSPEGWRLKMEPTSGASNKWSWRETMNQLPDLSNVAFTKLGQREMNSRKLQITGLPQGNYRLHIDGEKVGAGSAADFAKGITIQSVGADRQRESLREIAVDKNMLFMHRYRPQNETYLFLFRKHEQGNNAPEVSKFEDLTRELDQKMTDLSKPREYAWELFKE